MGDFFAGTNNAAQQGLSKLQASLSGNTFPQQFRTLPIPNFNLAIYQLQIRDSMGGLTDSFIFPLSPQSVRKVPTSLSNYYDVAGDNTNFGVQRIFDIYGITPVTFMIEGTTGWKYHSGDNYQYTGLQAISRLEAFILEWATLNQTQIQNGNPNLYELWFFDYFRNEYWAVVPVGEQIVRQNEARPLLVYYSFRLVASRNLASPTPSVNDPISVNLSTSAAQAGNTVTLFASGLISTYQGVTPAAQ